MKILLANILDLKADVFKNIGFSSYTVYKYKLNSELLFHNHPKDFHFVFKFTLSRCTGFILFKDIISLDNNFIINLKNRNFPFHGLSYDPETNVMIENDIEYSLSEHHSTLENKKLISNQDFSLICGNHQQTTYQNPLSLLKDHTIKDLLFCTFSEQAKNDVLSLVVRRKLFFTERAKQKQNGAEIWRIDFQELMAEKEKLEKLGYIMEPIKQPITNLNDPNLILRAENASLSSVSYQSHQDQ